MHVMLGPCNHAHLSRVGSLRVCLGLRVGEDQTSKRRVYPSAGKFPTVEARKGSMLVGPLNCVDRTCHNTGLDEQRQRQLTAYGVG
jgi:hypothetical protein